MSALQLSQLAQAANRLSDVQVRLNTANPGQVMEDTNPTGTARNQTLDHLKTILGRHYSAAVVDESIAYAFGKDTLAEARTHVQANGMEGWELEYILEKLPEIRNTFLEDAANNPVAVNDILATKLEQEIQWPPTLNVHEQGQVRPHIMEVLNEFAAIYGPAADAMTQFIGSRIADIAAEIKADVGSARMGAELTQLVIDLKAAMAMDAANTANQSSRIDHAMGDLTRALAPKLENGTQNFGRMERSIRFDMDAAMVNAMPNEQINVTLNGRPQQISLKDVFDHQNPLWKELGTEDRQKVVVAFKTLHAQTHGYPDKVTVSHDSPSDALAYDRGTKAMDLNLTAATLHSGSAHHVLKTLAHELTHAYQFSLIGGENNQAANIPDQVTARYDFDARTRPFTKEEHRVTDFAVQQNNYARNYTERSAIESEHAVLQMMSATPPNKAALMTGTDNLDQGGAGQIRLQEWTNAFESVRDLARAETNPTAKAMYLAEAAGFALELGNVGGRNFLNEAKPLLDQLDFSQLRQVDKAVLSEKLNKNLNELYGRARSGAPEKAFAKENVTKFQIALMESTRDGNLQKTTKNVALANIKDAIKNQPNRAARVDLMGLRADVRIAGEPSPAHKLAGVIGETRPMFAEVNNSGDRDALDRAIAKMTALEAQIRPMAGGNNKLLVLVDGLKTNHEELSRQRDLL